MDEQRKTSTLTQVYDTLTELDKLSNEILQIVDQIGDCHPTTQTHSQLQGIEQKPEPQPRKTTIIESIDNTIKEITDKQDTIHHKLTQIKNWAN